MNVERTKENLSQCRCMKCPSYTNKCKFENMPENLIHMMQNLQDTDHFEGMFCAFEKRKCIKEDKGCLCKECPVYKNYGLNKEDYCLQTGGK